MMDGCGLSPMDAVSAKTFSLYLMKNREVPPKDALILYMPGYSAFASVKAKTGYMERTRSIAGYILDAKGIPVKSFCIIINNCMGLPGRSRIAEQEILKMMMK